MNYTEAVNWLYTQLPMYQRIGAAAYKADLNNTIKLCNYFNNPQDHFQSVHIAGTNGKGSTSHMLAAILQESGYKVGLYTSPHLKSFTERIRINGKEIAPDFVVDFVAQNKDFFSSFDPSFFEITVAMAFCYFNQEKVDIAIIETGLGGRLDSTNIITPVLSVITNIGLDHQQLLGNTVKEIAAEKAGIIKQGVPVVIGQLQADVADVFTQKASDMNAPILFADKEWTLKTKEVIEENEIPYQVLAYQHGAAEVKVQTDQLGSYQEHNCKTVLAALEQIRKAGFDKVSDPARDAGFKQVTALTGLKGRWQILGKEPLIIADTGHNEDGIRHIISQLKKQEANQLRMVIGFVNDKSITNILQLLPRNAIYYFTQADIPRAKPAEELYVEAIKTGLRGNFYIRSEDALNQAKMDAMSNDIIFIGGSTFIVAELI
jgi:dihydrofolate synthase/folylpolyglutamate synthase